MRLVHAYLVVYFALVMGAGLALWQAGILARLAPLWIVLTALGVTLLGLLLAYLSAPPPVVASE